MKKREGFTLIELLVVIAVITFMTAILLPSLRKSKLQSEALLCGTNIRQLLISLTMYEDDNGTFPHALDITDNARFTPPPGGYVGNASQDMPGWWWFHYIADYSKKEFYKDSIIWCPSRDVKDINLKTNVLCANYGVNQSVCKSTSGGSKPAEFTGIPLSRSDIQRQGETLLIVDSGYSMINWRHVTNIPPEPLGNTIKDAAYVPGLKINEEKKLWPGLEWDAIKGRHPNRTVNAGFVDGHISRIKADDLFVENTQAGYTNLYPLWQPIKRSND